MIAKTILLLSVTRTWNMNICIWQRNICIWQINTLLVLLYFNWLLKNIRTQKILDGRPHLVVPLEIQPGKRALETEGQPLELFPASF